MKLKVVFESERIHAAYLDGEKKFAWSAGNSGIDLRSSEPDFVLNSGDKVVVSSGIRAQIVSDDDLWEIQLRPRSGMSAKGILKHFGTIDHSYTGVIGVSLMNLSKEPIRIEFGDRIAQMVVCPIAKPEIEIARELSATDRGNKGFGASGIK
jgi:dUTP pyrophosphatase